MNDPTVVITVLVRKLMSKLARELNRLTGGALKPSHITTISLLGHAPAVWALATGRFGLAAVLIAYFGLLDALDGSLAREQNTASKQGMFYDAVSDRIKEVAIYAGLAIYSGAHASQIASWLIVSVAGSSLLVSYIKAKGEMAVSSTTKDKQALNKLFSDGLARYEIRMALLVAGLIFGYAYLALRIILILNVATAAWRFFSISQYLSKEESRNK